MIKKCMGCGLDLQDSDITGLGYTPDLKNDYCKRCFRLKNYGEKKEGEEVASEYIITRINKSKGVVFFLVDYLNINKFTIDIFKKINLPKALVISKSDTLRKDMKFEKIKNWLRKVYGIFDDVLFISNKNGFRNVNIFKYMDKYKLNTCYIMGITNAGKSTFINSLLKQYGINKEIVVSNKPNTTLDFIKLKFNDYIVYDTPGFDYLNLDYKIVNSVIKPITLNIIKPIYIRINDTIDFYFDKPNKVVIYTTYNNVKRTYKNILDKPFKIEVANNSDVVLPGIGYVNVKEASIIYASAEILEVRPNISGEDYYE